MSKNATCHYNIYQSKEKSAYSTPTLTWSYLLIYCLVSLYRSIFFFNRRQEARMRHYMYVIVYHGTNFPFLNFCHLFCLLITLFKEGNNERTSCATSYVSWEWIKLWVFYLLLLGVVAVHHSCLFICLVRVGESQLRTDPCCREPLVHNQAKTWNWGQNNHVSESIHINSITVLLPTKLVVWKSYEYPRRIVRLLQFKIVLLINQQLMLTNWK